MKKQETSNAAAGPQQSEGPAISELNEVSVIGRLVRDPFIDKDLGVPKRAAFMLAVPLSYNNGSGKRVKDTSFVPVLGRRAIAQQCEGLRKGDMVRANGPIMTWKTSDEIYHWRVDVLAFQVLEKAAAAPAAQRRQETSAA